jgi:hypothetical protein
MRKPDGYACLSVLVLSFAFPVLASGSQSDASPPGGPRPCLMVVDAELKPFVELAWEHSATFRAQCRTLGAGRAAVIVRTATVRETLRADSRITVSEDGGILGRIRINAGSRVLEHLGHEFEHVVERVQGVNLLMESQRGGSRVVLGPGTYETQRAIDAGIRVAEEVREATRTKAK